MQCPRTNVKILKGRRLWMAASRSAQQTQVTSDIVQRFSGDDEWLFGCHGDCLWRSLGPRYKGPVDRVGVLCQFDKICQPGNSSTHCHYHTPLLLLPDVTCRLKSSLRGLFLDTAAVSAVLLCRFALQHLQTRFDVIWRCGWMDQAVGLLTEQI